MKTFYQLRQEMMSEANNPEEVNSIGNLPVKKPYSSKPLKSMAAVKKDAKMRGMELTHIVRDKSGRKIIAAVTKNKNAEFVWINNNGVSEGLDQLQKEMMTAGDAGIPQDTANMKPKRKQKPLTRHYVEIMGKRKKVIK